MHRTPTAATATQILAPRPLHWDALAVLRALEHSGTAEQVQARVLATDHVRLSDERAHFLLGHLVGAYRLLRGEQGIYVRLEPGAQAVREADAQRQAVPS